MGNPRVELSGLSAGEHVFLVAEAQAAGEHVESLVATGVTDEHPTITGLAEHWGSTVLGLDPERYTFDVAGV